MKLLRLTRATAGCKLLPDLPWCGTVEKNSSRGWTTPAAHKYGNRPTHQGAVPSTVIVLRRSKYPTAKPTKLHSTRWNTSWFSLNSHSWEDNTSKEPTSRSSTNLIGGSLLKRVKVPKTTPVEQAKFQNALLRNKKFWQVVVECADYQICQTERK